MKKLLSVKIGYAFLLLLVVAQAGFLYHYQTTQFQKQELKREVKLWSALEGEASARKKIDKNEPLLRQVFINQHEELHEFILFLFHCAEADSGTVYVRLKDGQEGILYEYSFEPMYMQEDVFCLEARPDEVWHLVPGQEYVIEIEACDFSDDDYIEAGITENGSKPAVFKEFEDGSTLFSELEYSYYDTYEVRRTFQKLIMIFGFADILLCLMILLLAEKWRKQVIAGIIVYFVFVYFFIGTIIYKDAGAWYNKNGYVVHAMGMIGGHAYTNSADAFRLSYDGGHKVFEVDFSVTSDGKIVLKHDWTSDKGLPQFENGYIPTHEEFMNAKIWEEYKTMDLKGLLDLMCSHPEIYIVTDSKSSKYKDVDQQFALIAKEMKEYSEKEQKHILEHLIVQIYNDDMYDAVSKNLPVQNYIYTLYQRGAENLDKLGIFCRDHSIPVVVLPYTWWTEDIGSKLHGYGLKLWVHTLNEPGQIDSFLKEGVDGIYTDATDVKSLPRIR